MNRSLFFKLLGAFLLVIAIGSLVIYFLTSRATKNAFTLYTTRSSQVWGARIAPELADYYTQSNSWQGVEILLQSILASETSISGNQNTMMGQGMGRGYGQGFQSSNGMMSGSDQRLILADARGTVVSDTQNSLTGKLLPATELENGTPILINNELIGTLIVTPDFLSKSGSPASEFLASVNQAIISSAIIAGGIAIFLGAVLFFQITSPLRQLRKAATAITNGDLEHRIDIHSRDEFGELGQTFNNMAESLSKAEKQRQHLMADVAHELRTPLSSIQGTLEAMQDGVLPLDEDQLTALHGETTLLNRLIGDLSLLSRAETGHLQLEFQDVDINKLIYQIVEQIKPLAVQKGVRLDADLQTGIPDIHLDPDRFAQIINNLVNNALRYTPNGGSITVKSALQTGKNNLLVSVTDTGSGITPENLPYIFDRFYRADKSRSRSSGGSGLGLSIVKQLVEAHNGQVYAESPIFTDKNNNGYGTQITFTLKA
jgi:signal transduction histidine kinase